MRGAVETQQKALRIAENLLIENPNRTNENYISMIVGYHAISELSERQSNKAQALENSRREFEIRARVLEFAPVKSKLLIEQEATAERIKKLSATN